MVDISRSGELALSLPSLDFPVTLAPGWFGQRCIFVVFACSVNVYIEPLKKAPLLVVCTPTQMLASYAKTSWLQWWVEPWKKVEQFCQRWRSPRHYVIVCHWSSFLPVLFAETTMKTQLLFRAFWKKKSVVKVLFYHQKKHVQFFHIEIFDPWPQFC